MNEEGNNGREILHELRLCESNVWEALVRGDAQADEASLAECFLGVYPDGFAKKLDHVQQLANGPTVACYNLSMLRVLPLGDGHAVLSYRADFTRTEMTESEAMYVSSIWRRTADGWINIFSQDTPAVN